VNGSGKTTLLQLLAGILQPSAGQVLTGQTVRLALLSQHASELPAGLTVLEAAEEGRGEATLASGERLTAGKLAERFGFAGERLWTRVGELSGGERRRLALMRLLMGEPNVLLLDEPTNDLDIDTLTALEDLLDGWPGTLVVVSHDRYFIERVCDNVFALTPRGEIRHLPAGIDQYLKELADPSGPAAGPVRPAAERRTPGAGGQARALRKELAGLEREIERAGERAADLQEQMAAAATDHMRLGELTGELECLIAEREALEERWLEISEALEQTI
jgi:ATP-binding cassette subfamily F protein uup